MLFQAVMKFLSRSKFHLKGERSIAWELRETTLDTFPTNLEAKDLESKDQTFISSQLKINRFLGFKVNFIYWMKYVVICSVIHLLSCRFQQRVLGSMQKV
jgi:hypothetical protein